MELTASVDRNEALAYLGYRDQELGELLDRLEDAAVLCEMEFAPHGVYSTITAQDALAILPGDDIKEHLMGCEFVALMAATLGPSADMLIRRESSISATNGLLVDACASSCIEQAANELNDLISDDAILEGFETTSRFSPGYGDLPLDCQSSLLKACGADKILGIALTDSNLMVPSKSITAVIGLYRKNELIDCKSTQNDDRTKGTRRCFNCALKGDCEFRLQGRTCYGS